MLSRRGSVSMSSPKMHEKDHAWSKMWFRYAQPPARVISGFQAYVSLTTFAPVMLYGKKGWRRNTHTHAIFLTPIQRSLPGLLLHNPRLPRPGRQRTRWTKIVHATGRLTVHSSSSAPYARNQQPPHWMFVSDTRVKQNHLHPIPLSTYPFGMTGGRRPRPPAGLLRWERERKSWLSGGNGRPVGRRRWGVGRRWSRTRFGKPGVEKTWREVAALGPSLFVQGGKHVAALHNSGSRWTGRIL